MTGPNKGRATEQWRTDVATDDDAPGIADVVTRGQQLWQVWSGPEFTPYDPAQLRQDWAVRVREASRTTLVVRDAGQVLGFVSVVPEVESYQPSRMDAGSAHVAYLFVHPEKHGTGVAQTLDSASVAAMRERSFVSARLWCPAANERARAFYEKCGYVATGTTTTFAGLDRLEYRRQFDV